MIFGRKNYLPDLNVYQDTDGKWFAECPVSSSLWSEKQMFYWNKDKSTGLVSRWEDSTKFDTLDDLMAALYEYTYNEHLKAIKKQLTYERVKVRL